MGARTETYLQPIVDVQTRHHHQEAVGIDTANKRLDDIGVPRLVRVVNQAVHSIRGQERDSNDIQPAECDLIILFGLLLRLTELVLVLKDDNIRQE